MHALRTSPQPYWIKSLTFVKQLILEKSGVIQCNFMRRSVLFRPTSHCAQQDCFEQLIANARPIMLLVSGIANCISPLYKNEGLNSDTKSNEKSFRYICLSTFSL